jgi:DNA-binding transcriptional regulator YiaG
MSAALLPDQDITSSRATRGRVTTVAISMAWAATMYVGVTGTPAMPPQAARALDEGRTSFQMASRSLLFHDVGRLRDVSGLSWQQIADAVGVTRRSVHYWANGGKISALHQARLHDVAATIAPYRHHEPEQVRAALLAIEPDGESPLSRLIRAHRPDHTDSITAADRLLSVEFNGSASETGTAGRSRPLKFNPQND